MKNNFYFNEINSQLTSYKMNILYAEVLLTEYMPDDKAHLLCAKLNDKLKNLEAMLEKLSYCDEKIQPVLQRYATQYFEKIKGEFHDFLIGIKYCPFNVSIENYKQLLKKSPQSYFLKRKILKEYTKTIVCDFFEKSPMQI